MNRNGYLNFIATAIAIALLAFGLAMTMSMNNLRFSVEEMKRDLKGIDSRISSLNLQAPTQATPSATASKPQEEAANAEFFDKGAQPGGRFITPLNSDTNNLNTLINNDAYASEICDKAIDSLAARNYAEIDKFEPLLAESWEVSADKLSYRIKLRKGVLWHDFTDPVSGRQWTDVEVTSADFKFYVDVVKNPDVDAAPLRVYLNDLDRVEIISDYEFIVHWSKKYFQSLEMTLSLSPLPRHLYHAYKGPFDGKRFNDDNERNKIIVGCGPYRFDSWERGKRVVLKRWGKYYGRTLGIMPPIETIVYEIIQHPNTRFQALLSKDIDACSLSPDQWTDRTSTPEFGSQGFIDKIKYPDRAYSYLGFNLKNPIFQDRRTRVALSHLVDRKRIVKDIYKDLARPVSGPFFMDSDYCDKSIEPYYFDIETAKALLKDAGWSDANGDGILEKDGRNLQVTVMYPNASATSQKLLPIIKEDMAKAGVQMELLALEWPVCVERLEKKQFDMCCLGWSLGLSPDPYQLWHSSQADVETSSNHIGFKNPEADRLIEEIRTCFDKGRRVELCHQFHRLIHEEAPYIFLFSPYAMLAINSRYKNIRVFPTGVPTSIIWELLSSRLPLPGGVR